MAEMTRLFGIAVRLGSALALASGIAFAAGQEYCAFEVSVASPAGAPVKGVRVDLLQNGVQFSTAATDSQGQARLCDSPPGLVDVRVGGKLCGAVTVQYLQSWWMETRPVSVTYSNCSGEEWVLIGACRVTVRVRDQEGQLVSGATLSEDGKAAPGGQPYASDSFGRIFFRLGYGASLSGEITKKGYLPSRLSEQCQHGKTAPREVVVTLRQAEGSGR